MPSCIIAMPLKKPPTAMKEAICPSPTRYQMPLPHPPASTIPMPKSRPPRMWAIGQKGCAFSVITPPSLRRLAPMMLTSSASRKARNVTNSLMKIVSRKAEFMQKRPRCRAQPIRPPQSSAVIRKPKLAGGSPVPCCGAGAATGAATGAGPGPPAPGSCHSRRRLRGLQAPRALTAGAGAAPEGCAAGAVAGLAGDRGGRGARLRGGRRGVGLFGRRRGCGLGGGRRGAVAAGRGGGLGCRANRSRPSEAAAPEPGSHSRPSWRAWRGAGARAASRSRRRRRRRRCRRAIAAGRRRRRRGRAVAARAWRGAGAGEP